MRFGAKNGGTLNAVWCQKWWYVKCDLVQNATVRISE